MSVPESVSPEAIVLAAEASRWLALFEADCAGPVEHQALAAALRRWMKTCIAGSKASEGGAVAAEREEVRLLRELVKQTSEINRRGELMLARASRG